ncbi:hypothetical protein REPUB_Repub09cG0005900 [Reevesia pubescens]
MGCRVSKFEYIAEEGAASLPCHQLSHIVHRRNDRAVVDSSLLSKLLPEVGCKGEEHAKGDHVQHVNIKKVNSEEKGGIIQRERVQKDQEACDKEGNYDRDDSIENPRSLSFSVYCILSLSDDDNNEGDSNAGKIKDKQQEDVQNNMGSSNRLKRRGRVGKVIKTGSAKLKSILRV